jgi:hypothetical protein
MTTGTYRVSFDAASTKEKKIHRYMTNAFLPQQCMSK